MICTFFDLEFMGCQLFELVGCMVLLNVLLTVGVIGLWGMFVEWLAERVERGTK